VKNCNCSRLAWEEAAALLAHNLKITYLYRYTTKMCTIQSRKSTGQSLPMARLFNASRDIIGPPGIFK